MVPSKLRWENLLKWNKKKLSVNKRCEESGGVGAGASSVLT